MTTFFFFYHYDFIFHLLVVITKVRYTVQFKLNLNSKPIGNIEPVWCDR